MHIKHFLTTETCSGQWLLDARLLNKRLDIRIKGTTTTLFSNGRYEGQCGHIVLDAVPISTEAPVKIRIGFEQTKANFRPRYLIPEVTTETPQYISASTARPIVQAPGERVVIIGPDIYGNSDLVGSFGLVICTPYAFPMDQACVQVCPPGPNVGCASYFVETSLCRSRPDYQ